MRTSKDIYKLDNKLIAVSCAEFPPVGSILWQGYDYEKQMWIFEGKKDERTLEEIRG